MQYTKDHPLRCFFAFAGYDSQALAFEMLKQRHPEFAYEIAGWSEIDKYAIAAHNALFPDAADKNYGDITQIDWSKVPDFDFFTYSSPCFVGGTRIITKDGYRNIENLHKGDLVLTHDGTYKKVVALGSDGEKPIFRLDTMGALPTECTANHPFLTRRRSRVWSEDTKRLRYQFDEPAKKSLSECVVGEDYIGIPILPDGNGVPFTKEQCWLLGRHLPDDFVSGASHKGIPQDFLQNSTIEQLRWFLEGYISGGGCLTLNQGNDYYQATTVSRAFAEGLVLAIQKAYGVGCEICLDKHDTYMVRWELGDTEHQWYNGGNYIWYPIRSIEDTGRTERIYNITVEDNHTYTANNIVCYNCQDFSNAGLQKGGEEGSGTRSSLLWEVRRAVLEKHPKYLMMENVKALVSQKFRPLFRRWEQELASYGYDNYCKVLNAKDYGIPQNRERIFCVSILHGGRFEFPKEIPLELKLKDVLEDKCAEKYYLDDAKVAKFIEHCDRKQMEGCGFKFDPTDGGLKQDNN